MGKCINTKIYQKGLNLLGEQKYSRFMTFNEDLVAITILFNIAESFKLLENMVFFMYQPLEV